MIPWIYQGRQTPNRTDVSASVCPVTQEDGNLSQESIPIQRPSRLSFLFRQTLQGGNSKVFFSKLQRVKACQFLHQNPAEQLSPNFSDLLGLLVDLNGDLPDQGPRDPLKAKRLTYPGFPPVKTGALLSCLRSDHQQGINVYCSTG